MRLSFYGPTLGEIGGSAWCPVPSFIVFRLRLVDLYLTGGTQAANMTGHDVGGFVAVLRFPFSKFGPPPIDRLLLLDGTCRVIGIEDDQFRCVRRAVARCFVVESKPG
jgi:hypothetical protein